MTDDGERVHGLVIHQDVELDQGRDPPAGDLVVERGVALRRRLQPVVEVEEDLGHGQFIRDHHAGGRDVAHVLLDAALVLTELEDGAHELGRGQNRGGDDRLFDRFDLAGVGQAGGRIHVDDLAVGLHHAVLHRGRGDDQLEAKLAFEALLDDLHVKEAKEAATEAKTERGRGLGLVVERGIVQAQLLHGLAQLAVLVRLDGIEAREHHGFHVLEAGQRLGRGVAIVGHGVADLGFGDAFDPRDHKPDFAGAQRIDGRRLGGEDAETFDVVASVGLHEPDLHSWLELAIDHVDENHDAAVLVEPGVEDEAAQRPVGIALGCWNPVNDGFKDVGNANPLLGRSEDGAGGVDADDALDLLLRALGFGGRQVDLVDDGDDFEMVLDRQMRIRESLGLDALTRVHHQQRALAGGERPTHLIAEVDVSRRVDEIEDVVLPVLRLVVEPDRVLLDGDAAFLLEVHGVEELGAHLARGQSTRHLHEAVGQRRLSVIDVGDDRKVADL